jgi:hypothetical protein
VNFASRSLVSVLRRAILAVLEMMLLVRLGPICEISAEAAPVA